MNKAIYLGEDWYEIGSYIDSKFFTSQDPTSSKYGQLMRKLTLEEFDKYDTGDILEGYLAVVGFGEKIFRNRITKEELRMPYTFWNEKGE